MIEMITLINSKLNDFVWGVPAMVLILGVGLWLSRKGTFSVLAKLKRVLGISTSANVDEGLWSHEVDFINFRSFF